MLRNEYIERLERGGFAKGQAEVQVSVFEDFMRNEVATKEDLLRLEERLEAKWEKRFLQGDARMISIKDRFNEIDERFVQIDQRFNEIDNRFNNLEKKVDKLEIQIKQSGYRLMISMAALLTAVQVLFKYFVP